MREIRYAEGSVLVSDALSDALLAYSRELARNDSADVIEVPVYFKGHTDVVKLLLGPASQLIDTPAPADSSTPDDSATIVDIRHRLDLLGPARPVPEEQSIPQPHPLDEL